MRTSTERLPTRAGLLDATSEDSQGVGSLLTRRKMWVGGLAVFGGIGYLVNTALSSTTVYYLTVSELEKLPSDRFNEAVRVAGLVAPGTISRSDSGRLIRFSITDQVNDTKPLPVVYSGLVPDVFNEKIEVVVQGRYTGEEFEASMLLAKCPSKFEASSVTE